MPFDATALTPLVTGAGFTLWLYRTPDPRAAAVAAGYFAPAGERLETGDLILLQAADAVALLPVRAGDVVASGLVVDTAAAPFRTERAAAQRFSLRQAAAAVVQTIVLAPLAAGLVANGTVEARATVAGPVAEVVFSLRDGAGVTVRGPARVPVAAGVASTVFAAPPAGTGYRMRAEAVGEPLVADTSPPFAVSAPFGLLTQSGGALLLQDGSRLLI
ncbi:MAG TPA: hypothetical protein VE033_11940 [Acetobacteraceae bacterium]|jgi:hypothetical protein|nr:hypothetical protein [Acetobacteraceae bacterium]